MKAEPVAVIGLACRFPSADNKDAFWQLLCAGASAIREAPPERHELHLSRTAARADLGNCRGGFLDHVDRFDPLFFGISPREAVHVDPQQRLMLELSWEALEDACLPPAALRDSPTGVFFGAMWNDYARLCAGVSGCIGRHTALGQDTSIIAARVSYTHGLRGPSMTINTASSSSLVAVHLACLSLRRGESTLALAGGVNLIIAPESTAAMSELGALSRGGHPRAFDAGADGYVRGEGGGVVVLKPLARARADGDPIYCVIRGSAVNNDGFSNGLAAPNSAAQRALLRRAYACARVSPRNVHFVETHGTGTALGDPAEADALGAVLGRGRSAARGLIIGSVKNNIGHLEAAAGIAGLMKAALAIKHRTIPPTINFERPNPRIPFDDLRLRVETALRPWPDDSRPALAGVSSFGFGGTNCHLVLEEFRPARRPAASTARLNLDGAATSAAGSSNGKAGHLRTNCLPRAELFLLSAHMPEALRQLALSTSRMLTKHPEVSLHDLCYTAAARRNHQRHRLSLVCRSTGELAGCLERFAEGEDCRDLSVGCYDPDARRKLAFVLRGRDSDAAEAGERLGALWRSWGIRPDAVLSDGPVQMAAAHPTRTVSGLAELSSALEEMLAEGYDTFLETGPRPRLACELGEELRRCGRAAAILPRTIYEDDEYATMLGALGALYTLGYRVAWESLYPEVGRCVRLPPYPWQRQRYWIGLPTPTDEPGRTRTSASRAADAGLKPVEEGEPSPPSPSADPLSSSGPRRGSEDERVAIGAAPLDAQACARAGLLEDYVREQVAKVLMMPPTEVDLHQPLLRLGVDSLMSLELEARVETDLGIDLAETPLQDFTVTQLVSQLRAQLSAGGPWEIIRI